MKPKISANDVLHRYMEEDLPEFAGQRLVDVNQRGIFGNAPLNIAATRGEVDEVSALLDGGADANGKGEHGCTPLHDAVGQGHIEIVRILLARGASRQTRNDEGRTPRDRASEKRLKEIVRLLDAEPNS